MLGKDENVRVKVFIALDRVCARVILDWFICLRTTAGIRQYADKEHYEQEPKARTNL